MQIQKLTVTDRFMNHGSERRLKVILISSCCDGTDVGEAWVSFQWARCLAERCDLTVLTYRKRDKPPAGPQLPGVRVVEWLDLPAVGKWERFNSMLKPGYVSFYLWARRWIKGRLRVGERFDLVHQITPVSLRYPSPAAGLGIPLVLGPHAGSIETPEEFAGEFGGAAWYTKLRNLDRWRLRHDPWLRSSFASADLLIGVAPYVRELLGDLVSHGFELMHETGITELPPQRTTRPSGTGPLRLLFVGRIVRSKGLRDAIRALAKAGEIGPVRFDVVGWGDDLEPCRLEAQRLGLGDKVVFHGRLPRNGVHEHYTAADIFVFPSFREPGGNAVLEAMSHGLPLIVADRGGPGFVVDDSFGFRIPATDPADFASKIAISIRQLAASPELRASMGEAAREKIRREFLWDAKARRMEQFYQGVLTRGAAKATDRKVSREQGGVRTAYI
jgi:glycosyltransferase involved in cell wall biosynthesis